MGHDRAAPARVRIDVDRDHVARAQRAAHGHGDRVDQRAIEQPAAFDVDRLEDAGQRVGCAHGIDDVSARQPSLMAGADFGCHSHEALGEGFDRHALQARFEHIVQSLAVDQARAGEIEIEKAQHLAARQIARKIFQRVELSGHVAAADHGADRCAGDDVGMNAGLVEGAENTDMRPSACRTAPERQTDLAVAHRCTPPKQRPASASSSSLCKA